MKIFNKVVIVGVGLIGGSLGLAMRKKKLAREIVGVARHRGTLRKAKSLGAIDRGTLELSEATQDADLIVIAIPVADIPKVIKKLISKVKPGCIITDVGSTKSKVVGEVERILPKGIHFVGGHPMAGSEKKGISSASVNLFKGSVCFLTKSRFTDLLALKKLMAIWRDIGARVEVVSPKQHDRIVASISHLPHLVAFNLAAVVPRQNLKYAAKGFGDTTRVAASDPAMWRDIYLTNCDEVKKALDRFIDSLKNVRALIVGQEGQRLLTKLKKAKKKRDSYGKR